MREPGSSKRAWMKFPKSPLEDLGIGSKSMSGNPT
jgi:hypothetical protein